MEAQRITMGSWPRQSAACEALGVMEPLEDTYPVKVLRTGQGGPLRMCQRDRTKRRLLENQPPATNQFPCQSSHAATPTP